MTMKTILALVLLALHSCRCFSFSSGLHHARYSLHKRKLLDLAPSKVIHGSDVDCCTQSNSLKSPGAWMPIIVTSDIDEKFPTEVELLGTKFVVWKTPSSARRKGWNVMQNVCPHRFAPLSEGRIDPHTGCLECPYHGWQFDDRGSCVKIPQLDVKDTLQAVQDPSVHQPALETCMMNDVLWAYIPWHIVSSPPCRTQDISNNNEPLPSFPTPPNLLLPELALSPGRLVMMREVPYSYDFALENFFDPAHVPFAHHGLQGLREDGSPIAMQLVHENASCLQVFFQDKIRGKKREGLMTFLAPIHYTLSVLPRNNTRLTIQVVPVSAGRSRLFIASPIQLPLPVFLLHALSMRFIDSDLWVADQERVVRGVDSPEPASVRDDPLLGPVVGPQRNQKLLRYALKSPSDLACVLWRKHWRKHIASLPFFGPSLPAPFFSKQQQRDYQALHYKHCKHCQSAHHTAQTTLNLLPSATALAFALSLFLPLHTPALVRRLPISMSTGAYTLLGVASRGLSVGLLGWLVGRLARAVARMTGGPAVHDRISAAQF